MSFCESPERLSKHTRSGPIVVAFAAMTLCVGLPETSWAQSTVVIGGSGKPSVVVNLDVLDQPQGGYAGGSRRLLMPGERPTEVVRLRLPGTAAQSQTGGTAPRLTLQRPAQRAVATPRPRPVQQAARPMPAAPTPKVVQRLTPPPAPAKSAMREAKPAPPPRAARRSEPQPLTPRAPQQVASSTPTPRPAPSAAPAPPPVPKAPPPAAVPAPTPKSPPPPPRAVAKAPPPPPTPRITAAPPPPPAPAPVVEAPPPAPVAPERPVQTARVAPKTVTAAPRPQAAERQTAALPRIPLPAGGGQILRVDFLGASTRLTPDAERRLGSLAATMMESDGRLQLKAYAGGSGETLSSARRLSLSRALSVRSFLIEQGIRSTRIDVRALGRAEDSGPPERVDIVLLMQ